MIRFKIQAAFALCLLASLSAMAQTNVPIALPADPSAAVITLDSHGFWEDRQRKNPNPALTIRADGTVIVTDPTGVSGDLSGKLSPTELLDLLKFVIQDQDFFANDVGEISRAIGAEEARTGRRAVISDVGEPLIRVKTADKEKEVRFYALAFYAGLYPLTQFPSMKALDHLNAIETRLTRIAEEVRGGGKQGVAAGLADVNAYLAREKPDLPRFTAEDYLGTMFSVNGRSMHFVHPGESGSSYNVAVSYRPNQEPEFRFYVYGPRSPLFGPAPARK